MARTLVIFFLVGLFIGSGICHKKTSSSKKHLGLGKSKVKQHGRIIGDEAAPHSIPFIVSIKGNHEHPNGSESTSQCGGTLLSDKWVLTAGHCLFGQDQVNFDLLIGAHNIKKPEKGRVERHVTIGDAKKHPDFDPATGKENDLGLLYLSEPVEEAQYIKYGRLPAVSQFGNSFKDVEAYAAGWGYYGDPGSADNISDVLRVTTQNIWDNAKCQTYYDAISVKINDAQMCFGGEDSGPLVENVCPSDSGGPLTITDTDKKPTVVGVVSYGLPCQKKNPIVFTRLTKQWKFITDTTGLTPRP